MRLFAQRWSVLVVVVDVDVVLVLVVVDVDVLVDVDVDVLVDVDVVLVVVSHPAQVLSHCLAIFAFDEHSPTAKRRSQRARGNKFLLFAHS